MQKLILLPIGLVLITLLELAYLTMLNIKYGGV